MSTAISHFTIPTSYLVSDEMPTANALNARLFVHMGDNGCSDFCTALPQKILHFFHHRYADFRMFWRSFSSMGGGVSSQDIAHRIQEISQFIRVIENSAHNRNAVIREYQRLSQTSRGLFFDVDQIYINEFVNNDIQAAEMGQEIIRECQRVIAFQRQLMTVNTFYRMFCGRDPQPISSTQSQENPLTSNHPYLRREPVTVREFSWGAFWGLGGDQHDNAETTHSITHSRVSPHEFNLNIPGTIAYVQNAIPEEVRNKAAEIDRLKVVFDSLENHAPVPEIYADTIMAQDFMSIPIFDASHPNVQEALTTTSMAGSTSTGINNRAIRHLVDKDALESHIATGRSYAPPKCPTCRHPADGGIRREYLRIDTALQDEILQFLRNAVARA